MAANNRLFFISCEVCNHQFRPKKDTFNLFFTPCGHLLCNSCKSTMDSANPVCLVCKKPTKGNLMGIFEKNVKAKNLQDYFARPGAIAVPKTREVVHKAKQLRNWQKQHTKRRQLLLEEMMKEKKQLDEKLETANEENKALEEDIRQLEQRLKQKKK